MARPRELTPEEAAACIRTRDTLGVPLGPGQPPSFLHALGERDDYEELLIFAALLVDAFRVFTRPGVSLVSGFFGPVERALAAQGRDVRFVPADFRRFAPLLRRLRPRVMATAAAPPDGSGRMSLALHAGATIEELRRCGADPERLLVVEVNPKLPRTLGLPPEHPHALAWDEVDVVVHGRHDPLTLPEDRPSEIHERIAEHACAYIPEGATLQTGIGGLPSAVARRLAEGEAGDYGVHTEMFTDGLMRLHEAGRVTNRKGIYDGFSVATFAAGTAELTAWLDGREAVRFLPVEAVNTPSLIARNRRMTALNGALAVDLFGQIAADSLDGHPYSGIGGHEDFTSGAGLCPDGRSLTCMPSTVQVGERQVSRFQARLDPGFLVTTPRHQVDVVVTEHGAAELAGATIEERARALIAVADPAFRDELEEAWRRLCHRARRDA